MNGDLRPAMRDALRSLPVSVESAWAGGLGGCIGLVVRDNRSGDTRGDELASLSPEDGGFYVSQADSVLTVGQALAWVERRLAEVAP